MKYFFTTFIFSILFIPTFLYAQTDYVPLADYDGILEPAIKGGFSTYLNTIMGIMIAIAAIAAVVMIVAGGLQYMTTDAVGGKSDGKKKITSAIGGLILALSSWLILQTINPNILKFDFKIDNVAKKGIDYSNRSIPDYVSEDLSTMTQEEREEWLKKNAENVNPQSTGNVQVTTFGGSEDNGVDDKETGSVTFEKLRGLKPLGDLNKEGIEVMGEEDDDYYIAYPLYGHNVRGLPQLAGGPGGGTEKEVVAVNSSLNDFYVEIEANGKIVRARIIDRGPSQGTNITNGKNKLDGSLAIWRSLGVTDGSTGSLTSIKLVPKSGKPGLVK